MAKGFRKFLVGAGIGAGLGLIFAPKKGSETREDLKKLLEELKDKAEEIDVDEIKLQVEDKIEEIKSSLEDLDKETVLKVAKAKAKELEKQANELVDYAVEKGTPVVEEMAENARCKAIEATKEILNKLEQKSTKEK